MPWAHWGGRCTTQGLIWRHMGASRLSCCPTRLHLDHLAEERSWCPGQSSKKKERKRELFKLLSSARWFPEGRRRSHTEGGKKEFVWCVFEASLEPSFVTKSIRLNRWELLFFSRVANREIKLSRRVPGPPCWKIKGESYFFIFFQGFWKTEPSFVTKSARLNRWELIVFFPGSKSRDLTF